MFEIFKDASLVIILIIPNGKSNSRCENGFVVMETDFIYICTETDRYNFVLDLMILVDLLDWWDC